MSERTTAADVLGIAITLEINGKASLFVRLAADGTINRMGKGTRDTTDRELFIGRVDGAIFQAVLSHVTEDMLKTTGQTFQTETQRGDVCKLTVGFLFKDSTSGGFALLYGSNSAGVPGDVRSLVTAAVRETDQWYENFKRNTAQEPQP